MSFATRRLETGCREDVSLTRKPADVLHILQATEYTGYAPLRRLLLLQAGRCTRTQYTPFMICKTTCIHKPLGQVETLSTTPAMFRSLRMPCDHVRIDVVAKAAYAERRRTSRRLTPTRTHLTPVIANSIRLTADLLRSPCPADLSIW